MFCMRYVYYTINTLQQFYYLAVSSNNNSFLQWIIETKKTIGEDYLYPLYCVLRVAKNMINKLLGVIIVK